MPKKRKKYLVTTNSEAYACSLVTSPAVEETFVAFNEEKPLVEKFADEKKHLVTGVVAIPNKPIYRRSEDGEEYDIVFSAEAIEKMSMDFMKNYRQHEVTLQHQEEAEGVYLVEQWIKTDAVNDKSIAVGLSRDLPIGTWIQTYYVDSHDVWKRIENGELQGFSLECMLGLQEFDFNKINKTDKNKDNMTDFEDETFMSKLREVINDVLATLNLKKEEKVEEFEAEPAPEPTPAPEPQAEPEPTPAPEPEPQVEPEPEPQPAPQPEPKDDKVNELSVTITNLLEEIKQLREMNGDLVNKVNSLGSQPSTKPVNTNGGGGGKSTYDAWREEMTKYL